MAVIALYITLKDRQAGSRIRRKSSLSMDMLPHELLA